jgi:hypothetical protein
MLIFQKTKSIKQEETAAKKKKTEEEKKKFILVKNPKNLLFLFISFFFL